MTVKDMMTNEQKIKFIEWGVKSKLYGMFGRMYVKVFKSMKYLDKSMYYLDKRWGLMTDVLRKHGCN